MLTATRRSTLRPSTDLNFDARYLSGHLTRPVQIRVAPRLGIEMIEPQHHDTYVHRSRYRRRPEPCQHDFDLTSLGKGYQAVHGPAPLRHMWIATNHYQ